MMPASSSDKWTLLFSPPPVNFSPLPNGVKRIMIQGPAGELELLQCLPKHNATNRPPILFQHGGFGSAGKFALLFLVPLSDNAKKKTVFNISILRIIILTPKNRNVSGLHPIFRRQRIPILRSLPKKPRELPQSWLFPPGLHDGHCILRPRSYRRTKVYSRIPLC